MRNKNSIMLLVIGVLLVTNLALLWMYLRKDNDAPAKSRSDRQAFIIDYLQNEVGFSSTQIDQYKSLLEKHHAGIKPIFEQLNDEKKTLLAALAAGGFSDSAIRTTAAAMKSKQETLEIKMLMHLRDIRMLCTADQASRFDTGYYKIVGRRKMEGGRKK